MEKIKITLEFTNHYQLNLLHGIYAANAILNRRKGEDEDEKNCIENMLLIEAELINFISREEIIDCRKAAASVLDLSADELLELMRLGLK